MGKATKYSPPDKGSFTEATHYLISEDSSGIPLYQDVATGNTPVAEMQDEDLVQVIEVNLGDKFQLAKIKDEAGTEYFIESIYVQPLADTDMGDFIASPSEDSFSTISSEAETHIKDLELDKSHLENGKYSVALDSGTTLKSEFESNVRELKKKGLGILLQHYGRVMEDLDAFVDNPFNLIDISEPYFPSRPGQNIKVKISVFKKYFESLEMLSFDEFAIRNLHIDFISTSFPADKLESEMRKISKILDKYASDINNFEGTLQNLDFKRLSSKSIKFFSDFKVFLSQNNISLDNLQDSKFELGFDRETFRLKYALLFDPYGKFLNIGVPTLASTLDAKMAKLLLSHKDILSSSISGMGWMDFCKTYFAGEFSILFTKVADIASLGKMPTSSIQKDIDKTMNSLDKLSFMSAKEAFGIASLLKSPDFRTTASDLLLNSRDMIGDNFLINLPEILMNIEDLSSLYQLVFDKVSIKDLTDIMMEKFSEEMDLPDFNEIKLRGILKTMRVDEVIGIIYDILSISEISDFNEVICKIYNFAPTEVDSFLEKFISVQNAQLYLLHYDEDGNIAGLLPESLPPEGTDLLLKELEKNNIKDCAEFAAAIYSENFEFKDYIDGASAAEIFCRIMSEGFPSYTNPCPELGIPSLPSFSLPSLKLDIVDAVTSLKKGKISEAIDIYMKDLFKVELSPGMPNIYQRFLEIPKIKIELNKLTLTKQKLLSKAPGLDIDIESKKSEVNFTLPSIKKVNPSFDFAKFQFGKIDDIFGGAMGSIEDAIVQGIEKGLVGAFKGVLKNVMKSMNLDMPDLRNPDFGGLSMNDLLDASPGTSADNVANLTLPKIKNALDRFDPNFFADDLSIGDIDLGDFNPNLGDLMNMMDDMSSAMKPLELTRILKGQSNSSDYGNMRANISNPNMRAILSEDLFGDVMSTVTDYIDINLVEELESVAEQGESIISFCENSGIPYKMGKVKDMLKDKYSDLSDEEIEDIIENIVEEAKDSVVDAIGNMKEDFNDNLPFDEDPCSFMPKPSDIPALNYVNDLTFDAIFDPIELEYKQEVASFPDIMMLSVESDVYVKLYYNSDDSILDPEKPPVPDPNTGLYDLERVFVGEDGVYNQDFGNHYYGRNTPLYELKNGKYQALSKDKIKDLELKKNDDDEWESKSEAQVYIKKQDQNLQPLPTLRKYMENPNFLLDYVSNDYIIDFEDTGVKITIAPTEISTEYTIPTNGSVECLEPFAVSGSQIATKSFRNKVYERVTGIAYESIGNDTAVSAINYANMHLNEMVANRDRMENVYDPSLNLLGAYGEENIDYAHLFVADTLSQIMKNISNVDLFDPNYMQTFLLDDDDVDLFRLQESKGAAKDEFNEECSFTEEGLSKLASSSIKKLIYLTIRIHIIDIVARGCFLYDSVIEDEPSSALKILTFQTMNAELLSYDNNYYDLFTKNYSKEYGSPFENNDAFSKIFDEIYTDISQFFEPALFQKSKPSVFKLIKDATSVFDGSWQDVPIHCETLLSGDNFPFAIQKLIKTPDGTELLWDDPMASTYKTPGTEYILRLCHVSYPQRVIATINEYRAINATAPLLGKTEESTIEQSEEAFAKYIALGLAEDIEDAYEAGELINEDKIIISKTQESVSFLYSTQHLSSQGGNAFSSKVRRNYILIPVAETKRIFQTVETPTIEDIRADEAGSSTFPTLKSDAFTESEDPYDLYSFFKDVIPTDLLYTALLMIIHSKSLEEKPSIALAFYKTKTTIRRAIESLSQDPEKYDFEENETKNNQLAQSQGVGTKPDFSANAAKMALMTVPMIIKGFAEMFDPNTQVASKVRMGADLAGFNIPPPIASLMCLPMNLIPFAPGPPITPLGLLYLATSFLEPKERKKLSDIRKGKKRNPGADQDTGSFIGGTEEELLAETAAAEQEKEEAIEESLTKIKETIVSCMEEIAFRLGDLRDKVGNIEAYGPDKPYFDFPDDTNDRHIDFILMQSNSWDLKVTSSVKNQMIKSKIVNASNLNAIIDSYIGYLDSVPYDDPGATHGMNSVVGVFYYVIGLLSPNNYTSNSSASWLANTNSLLNWIMSVPLESSSGASVQRFLQVDKFVYARQVAYHTERAQYIIQRLLALCMHNILIILKQDIPPAIAHHSYYPNFKKDYRAAGDYFHEVIVHDYLRYLTNDADSTSDYENLQDNARSRWFSLLNDDTPEGEPALRQEINEIISTNMLSEQSLVDLLGETYEPPAAIIALLEESQSLEASDQSAANIMGSDPAESTKPFAGKSLFKREDTETD